MTEDRGQRADDRGLTAEARKQRSDARELKTDNRRQNIEFISRKVSIADLNSGDRRKI
jgi:hypothetical protein